MWASTVSLQIGNWVVGVRADSDRTASCLRRFLLRYVVSDPGVPVRMNFSVRAPRGHRWMGRPGQLYVAGEVAARSSEMGTLLEQLAAHLAAVASATPDTAQPRARLFVRGGRAVVADARRDVDVASSAHGIGEISTWRPIIDAERRVVRSVPPLPGLDWTAVGREERDPIDQEFELVGLVLPADRAHEPDIEGTWLRTLGDLDRWGLLLDALDHEGKICSATTPEDVRRAVRRLLA